MHSGPEHEMQMIWQLHVPNAWYHDPEKHKINIQNISVACDHIYCLIYILSTVYVFPTQKK
jgi:hypothetical protein